MVRVDEVVETKYPPGDKVSTDPTGQLGVNTVFTDSNELLFPNSCWYTIIYKFYQ